MAKSIIVAEDVTKRFGDIVAVDGISFEVKAGEIFAFLGPNGAGKSTTISMLTTMLRPTAGKLTLNGHDVTKDQASVRKSFGIVFQDPAVEEELTAYENMHLHAVMYHVPKKSRPFLSISFSNWLIYGNAAIAMSKPIRAVCAGAWKLPAVCCITPRFYF